MRAWSRDDDMWKRRVSIICQISFKKDTDRELLYANIEPNLADRNFFIRKAIGWALRSYAWTEPEEVARYVAANEARLSGLSRREALRHVVPRSSPSPRPSPEGGKPPLGAAGLAEPDPDAPPRQKGRGRSKS
jgi:hypothetical protein